MKKLVSIIALSAMLICILAGCGNPAATTTGDSGSTTAADTSWDDIKSKGKMVIGLDDSFPPMGFRDENNEIVGFDIDMAKACAEVMGIDVEFKPINWDSKMLELNGKNIDLIWNGFSISPDREKEVLFTQPYLANKQIIVTMQDSSINTKADLAGQKVGLQGGSTAEDALKKDTATYESIGDSNIMRFKDNNTAMMDLETGRVSAVVLDEVVCRYYISKKADSYRILEETFDPEYYAVGARLEDKAFVAELQKALDEVKENGKAAEISTKWFGSDIVE